MNDLRIMFISTWIPYIQETKRIYCYRNVWKARIPDQAVASTHHKLELPEYGEGFDELFYACLKDGNFIVDEWRGIEE